MIDLIQDMIDSNHIRLLRMRRLWTKQLIIFIVLVGLQIFQIISGLKVRQPVTYWTTVITSGLAGGMLGVGWRLKNKLQRLEKTLLALKDSENLSQVDANLDQVAAALGEFDK